MGAHQGSTERNKHVTAVMYQCCCRSAACRAQNVKPRRSHGSDHSDRSGCPRAAKRHLKKNKCSFNIFLPIIDQQQSDGSLLGLSRPICFTDEACSECQTARVFIYRLRLHLNVEDTQPAGWPRAFIQRVENEH